VAAVRPFLDFRDLSTPAGELDVVADFKVIHTKLLIRRFLHQPSHRDCAP
jgi:hypothetical protein